MAKIAEYLKRILSARYGRDVRQSIHDAISAINDESTECWATVEKVPETLAIAAVKDTVSGKDITLEMSSDFVLTDFKAWGNTEQDTTTGKNLFDITTLKIRSTTQGGKITFDGDTANISSANQTWAICYSEVLSVEAGTPLTFKFRISNYSATTTTYTYLVSEDGVNYSNTFAFNGNGYYEITAIPTDNTVKIGVCSNGSSTNVTNTFTLSEAQLEVGTVATEYEPFTNGASPNPNYPQEIKSVVLSEIRSCGNQLLNYDLWKNVGVTKGTTVWENNGVTITATENDAYTLYHLKQFNGAEIPVSEGDVFTLSWEEDTNANGLVYVFFLDKTGNVISNAANNNSAVKRIRITIPSGIAYMTFRFGVLSAGTTISYKNIMLNKGSTQLPYEPYQGSVTTLSEPITMNGIGGVQDYVDLKRGVLVQKFKEITLSGSKNWSLNASGTNYYYAQSDGMGNKGNIRSTHFGMGKWGNNTANLICMSTINTATVIGISHLSFASVDDLKAFLASNEVKVVYELATPIETPLPDADVEALKNIRTFKGITHVFTDSEVKPDMEVEYVIDTKMYIDKKIAELA